MAGLGHLEVVRRRGLGLLLFQDKKRGLGPVLE